MASREELAEGQLVVVTDQQNRDHQGEIVTVGRTLVTIKYGPYRRRTGKFRIGSQRYNGEIYGCGLTFRTMDQAVLDSRRAAALATIKAHDFMPRLHTMDQVPLGKLEAVAAVLENWPPEQEVQRGG